MLLVLSDLKNCNFTFNSRPIPPDFKGKVLTGVRKTNEVTGEPLVGSILLGLNGYEDEYAFLIADRRIHHDYRPFHSSK